MSDFKAKMHQNRLGLRPRPRCGSLQRSPDPQLDLRGPTSNGRAGEGKGGEGKGVEGMGGEGLEATREGRGVEGMGGDGRGGG